MASLPPREERNDFFASIREWSRRKHEVLFKYLKPFARILHKVYVIDGFAGRGYYGDGEEREDGSPLAVAKLAQELAPLEISCINVERGATEFFDLQEATLPYADIVENIHGDFGEEVDSILEKIGNAPAFFFVDPFGFQGLTWKTIAKIGRRNAKTELLITFFAPAFNREAALARSDEEIGRSYERHLRLVMGDDRWKTIGEDPSLKYEQRGARVTNLYCQALQEDLGFMANKFPIREQVDGRLKYYLIFATRNRTGRKIMSEVFYGVYTRHLRLRAKRQEQERLIETRQPVLLGMEGVLNPEPVEEVEAWYINLLRDDVETLLRERGELTFLEVHDELIPDWFGQLIGRHYKQVCQELRARAKIDYDRAKRLPSDDTVIRYIG